MLLQHKNKENENESQLSPLQSFFLVIGLIASLVNQIQGTELVLGLKYRDL
jgi:hypothetical protein